MAKRKRGEVDTQLLDGQAGDLIDSQIVLLGDLTENALYTTICKVLRGKSAGLAVPDQ